MATTVQDLLQQDFKDDPTKEVVDVPTSEPLVAGTELDLEQVGEAPLESPEEEPQTTEDLLDSAVNVATGRTEEEIQTEQDVQDAEQTVLDTLEEPSERAREEARLEERVGIPEFEQEIADLNSAIRLKAASLRRGLVDTEGRPIAMQFITGRQAQMKRIAAAEIEGLSAAVSAAQGNIAAAESRIDRALNRKYGDTEANINRALSVLKINEGKFTRAEKKAAEERQAELAILEEKIKENKAKEKNALESIMTAITNGLNPEKGARLIEQVTNGEIEPHDVIRAVGGKLRDPLKILNEQMKSMEIQALRNAELRRASGEFTKDQSEAVSDLTKQLRGEASYKEMFEIRAGYNTAKVGFEQNNGFGDIAMVNGYQRIIDPGATVRGEDINTQAEAVSFVQQILALEGRVLTGDRFTPEVRTKLMAAANAQYTQRVNDFESTTKTRYERVLQNHPDLRNSNVGFGDIGDTFDISEEAQEPTDPATLEVGAEFTLDGKKYIKVGNDTYEEIK